MWVVLILALAIRVWLIPQLPFHHGDYDEYLSNWYDLVRSQGFGALWVSDYNVPYLYLFSASAFLPIPKIAAIKIVPILFDLVVGVGVYKIVRLRYSRWALLAMSLTLFAPTVVTNGALWGQCDSVYTSFLLWFVYYLLRAQKRLATICFGIAVSFKLQALFLLPVALLFLPWYYVWIPVTIYFLLLTPAYFLGRSWDSLFHIYGREVDEYQQITMAAPNLYQWFGSFTRSAALVLTAVVAVLTMWVTRRDSPLRVALIFAVLMPFFLPSMHERYFYPADVLSIPYAFYTRQWLIPVLMQLASFLSYLTCLLPYTPVSLTYVAILPLVVLLLLYHKRDYVLLSRT